MRLPQQQPLLQGVQSAIRSRATPFSRQFGADNFRQHHSEAQDAEMKKGSSRASKHRSAGERNQALRTGSSAPTEERATLEAEIGAEVRRLRKGLDLTVS